MLNALIFDWSGTLVNDLPPVLETTNRLLKHHGRTPMSEEEFRTTFRLPFKGFYDEVLPEIPLEELEEQYASLFPQARSQVSLLPHADRFLEFCRRCRWRLFILSSARKSFLVEQAKSLGILHYFEEIHAGIVDKRIALPGIIDRHLLDPATTAFVGDMEHDIDAAKAAGVHGIAVLTGYDSPAKLARSNPEIVVSHLGRLRQLLATPAGPAPAATTADKSADPELIIRIRGLELKTRIGVPHEERSSPQAVLADIDLTTSPAARKSASSDDINDTVDYHTVCDQVTALAARGERRLVELLAREIIDDLAASHPITAATVTLRKNILPNTEWVGVTSSWQAGAREPT